MHMMYLSEKDAQKNWNVQTLLAMSLGMRKWSCFDEFLLEEKQATNNLFHRRPFFKNSKALSAQPVDFGTNGNFHQALCIMQMSSMYFCDHTI